MVPIGSVRIIVTIRRKEEQDYELTKKALER
jgi:hypothetical protein